MRKIASFIFIIVALTFFSTGCKKMEVEFTFAKLEGSGYYDADTDTSYIKVEGWLQINQPDISDKLLTAYIEDWQFIVKDDDFYVLNLIKNGYMSVIGDSTFNESSSEYEYLWVYIETTTPKSGDIFNGYSPDTLEFNVIVNDENGQQYSLSAATTFEFTR